MKKILIVFFHFAFWGCYFLLLSIWWSVLARADVEKLYIDLLVKYLLAFAVVPAVTSFYLFYFFLFPKYLKHVRIGRSIVMGMIYLVVSVLLGGLAVSAIDSPDHVFNWKDDYYVAIGWMSFIALVAGIVSLITRGFITWYNEIKVKEVLIQKTHEMELALVKSQLDPHFLFNTINNIDVLILNDATKASNFLNKLSDIMRFMLFEAKTENIPLNKEIEYIEKYVELQKIRTSNPNYINFSVIGDPEYKYIAPMIFIPYIENAFKYSINKKLDNAINVEIRIGEENISMKCVNRLDKDREVKVDSFGLGNQLMRKRLDLLYPMRYELKTNADEVSYSVFLKINYE